MSSTGEPNLFVRSVRDHPIGWSISWFLFAVFPAVLSVWHDLASDNSLLRAILRGLSSILPDGGRVALSPLSLLWITLPLGIGMIAYVAYLVKTRPAYAGQQLTDDGSTSRELASPEEEVSEEVLGLFDLLDKASSASERVVELGQKIIVATKEFNAQIKGRSQQLERLDAKGQELRRQARPILSEAASEVREYAGRVDELEGPLGDNIEEALGAWSEAATIYDEDFNVDIGEVMKAKSDAENLADVLARAEKEIGSFQNTVRSWPRITKEIIHAKSQASSVLGRLRTRFDNGASDARKAESKFGAIIEKHESA